MILRVWLARSQRSWKFIIIGKETASEKVTRFDRRRKRNKGKEKSSWRSCLYSLRCPRVCHLRSCDANYSKFFMLGFCAISCQPFVSFYYFLSIYPCNRRLWGRKQKGRRGKINFVQFNNLFVDRRISYRDVNQIVTSP